MANKWVYLFSEGNANMRELLGGKGANLAEMTGLGLPVPQGFTITTEACTQYYEDGRKINDEIMGQIMEYIERWKRSPARSLVTGKIHFWFPFVPVQEHYAWYDGYHSELRFE